MPASRRALVLILALLLPGAPTLAQTHYDLTSLRFGHQVLFRRAEVLFALRDSMYSHLEVLSLGLDSLDAGETSQRMMLLREAQLFSDSLSALHRSLQEATPEARETAQDLLRALEEAVGVLQDRVQAGDPDQESRFASQLQILKKEVEEVEAHLSTLSERPTPGTAMFRNLAGIVMVEHARLSGVEFLKSELFLFLGGLRLFDETGVPPSDASGGGGSDPGGSCASACAPIPPADLPISTLPVGEREGEEGSQLVADVTATSLARLQDQLLEYLDPLDRESLAVSSFDPDREREVSFGLRVMNFRDGASAESGAGANGRASFSFGMTPTPGTHLAVDPSLGLRILEGPYFSSVEFAGEVVEQFTGGLGRGDVRWRFLGRQKGRLLSETPRPPVFLGPSRVEASVEAQLSVPVRNRLRVEFGGTSQLTRYDHEDWRILNRQGAGGFLGLLGPLGSGSARVTLSGLRQEFPREEALARVDTHLGFETGWTIGERGVVQLSLAANWNDSNLPAYIYRWQRLTLTLSRPLGVGHAQLYGALAHKAYRNSGTPESRVAPSDQDMGSMVAFQWTRPLSSGHQIRVQAEWSRSETGFRNVFFQRLGLGVYVSFPNQ